jgi:hypothetical protein
MTREGALELVAEIIDRGLRRREERVTRSAKRRNVTATAPKARAS